MRTVASKLRSNADRVFGYDVFVSFALGPPPRGSRSYASDLARRLRERDFTVFFSEEEAPVGDQLDTTLRHALHRSRILVVIANSGTLADPRWVKAEVEEFRRKHPERPVIPINIGNALQDPTLGPGAEPWLRFSDKIWIDETQSAGDEGVVSESVLERLVTAPNAMRSRTRWRWTVRAAFAVLSIVTASALWFAWSNRQNAQRADAAAQEALKNAATARANEIQAEKNAEDASRESKRAVAAEGEARQALQRAENENAQVRASLIASRAEQIRMQAPQAAALVAAESVQRLLDSGLEPTTATLQTLLRTLETIGGVGLPGHTQRVTAVAISPDSRWLATGDTAGEVLLREARNPKRVAYRFKGHKEEIRHIEFDRDSKRLVSTATDDARVWSLAAPAAPPIMLGGHDHFVYSASFDKEGSHVVTGSGRGVSIWDLSKAVPTPQKAIGDWHVQHARFALGEDLVVFCGADGVWTWRWKDGNTSPQQLSPKTSFRMALSRDGRQLAAGFTDGSLLVWDLSAGQTPVHSLSHGGSVSAVAFDESGTRLASASATVVEQSARIWDLTGEHKPIVLHAGINIEQLSFSANGDVLVTTGRDVVLLWSTYWLFTPAPIELRGHEGSGSVSQLALSADGRFMLTAGYEAIPRFWDLQQLDPRLSVLDGPGSEGFEALAITRRLRRIAATSRYDAPAVWDLDNLAAGSLRLQKPLQKNDFQVVLSEDGRWLATSGVGLPSFLWDLRRPDQAPRKLSAHASYFNKVAFTPDSSWIAMLDESGPIVLEGTADPTRPHIRLSKGMSSIGDFEIDPSGQRVVSVHSDGTAFLWPLSGGEPRRLSMKGPSLRRVKLSPRGRFAAAIGEGRAVRLWALPDGRERSLRLPAGASATRLSFDEKEGFLAVGTAEGQVLLYELAGSGKPHVLRSHTEEILGLAFDPSGKWLASVTLRDGIRLWKPDQTAQSPIQLTTEDLRTASPGNMPSSREVMKDIAFVGPGLLAAATGEGTVHVWKVDPQGWVDAARKAAGRTLTKAESVRYLEKDGQ